MFRRSTIGQQLIAFLIPITFVWSWAACTLLCTEIVEHHTEQQHSVNLNPGENFLNSPDSDSCPMTAYTAVIDTRQTITTLALTPAYKNLLPERLNTFLPISIFPIDVRQNSPPTQSSDPPLFIQFGNFRI